MRHAREEDVLELYFKLLLLRLLHLRDVYEHEDRHQFALKLDLAPDAVYDAVA